jgi:hypothetical protein
MPTGDDRPDCALICTPVPAKNLILLNPRLTLGRVHKCGLGPWSELS